MLRPAAAAALLSLLLLPPALAAAGDGGCDPSSADAALRRLSALPAPPPEDRSGLAALAGRSGRKTRVYYEYHPAEGEAVTYVLLHGVASDSTGFDAIAHRLAADGFGVLRLDLLGHGKTLEKNGEERDTIPFAEQLAAVEGVVESLPVGRIRLVGHSYGGAVAVGLAARPALASRIDGLHLIAPYVRRLDQAWLTLNPLWALGRIWWEPWERSLLRETLVGFIGKRRPEDDPALVQRKAEAAVAATFGILELDSTRQVAGVGREIPVQVIYGSEDQVVPAEQLEELVDALRATGHRTEQVVIAGGSHLLPVEDPGRVAGLLVKRP